MALYDVKGKEGNQNSTTETEIHTPLGCRSMPFICYRLTLLMIRRFFQNLKQIPMNLKTKRKFRSNTLNSPMITLQVRQKNMISNNLSD